MVYCRYQGENSQRHLEETRLKEGVWGVREEEKREERRQAAGERTKKEAKSGAKMTDFFRRGWGKGSKAQTIGWRGLG